MLISAEILATSKEWLKYSDFQAITAEVRATYKIGAGLMAALGQVAVLLEAADARNRGQ